MPPTPRGRPLLLLLPRTRSAPRPPLPPPSPAASTRRCPRLSTTSCTPMPAEVGPSPPRRRPASVRPESPRGRAISGARRGGRPDEAQQEGFPFRGGWICFPGVSYYGVALWWGNNCFVTATPNWQGLSLRIGPFLACHGANCKCHIYTKFKILNFYIVGSSKAHWKTFKAHIRKN